MSETITAIDPLPSDPNVLRVRVDGRIIARLSRTDVDTLELAAGQPWTAEIASRVQRAVDAAKTRKAAFVMLGRRALARGEIIHRLEGKGHEPSIVAAVVEQLENDGWIDDRAYARSIVHEVTRSKPATAELLVQKLQARKIDVEIARAVADEAVAEIDAFEAAEQLARQRLKTMGSLPRHTAARRIAGTLARRGFDEETVETVIERLGLLAD